MLAGLVLLVETSSGKSTCPGQMGHFYSGSHGSLDRKLDNLVDIFKSDGHGFRVRFRTFVNIRLSQ